MESVTKLAVSFNLKLWLPILNRPFPLLIWGVWVSWFYNFIYFTPKGMLLTLLWRDHMQTTITVIRHAPTEYNKKSIFMGTKDIPVDSFDEKGIQIIRDNEYIKQVSFLYSSPLGFFQHILRSSFLPSNKNRIKHLLHAC